ncbi:pseudouridylate synthase 1 homolog [Physella acuta]|uniref:pseudouridylate synthase 1 homolog n=1 Tax=Physella acuta TaxID=109671 RepID=UPI0027DD7457|nr:pseudouridylate synthase 1 homolog [Physella acuta]
MYMMPTFAFAPLEKFITEDYRTTPEILQRVQEILTRFKGTHKFHNFTSGVKYEQACASRYIIKFECSEPYVRDGLEFVTLRVKGQSFMLHHIRKMIGLTIAILRGYCGESVIDSSWGPEKVDIPKAPGLGLVLEQLHFNGYNQKFGSDGVHELIDWSSYEDVVEKFKEEQIIASIVEKEKSEKVMFNWLRTLQFHNFDMPRLESPEKPWAHITKNSKAGNSSPVKTSPSPICHVDSEAKTEVSPSETAGINESEVTDAAATDDVQKEVLGSFIPDTVSETLEERRVVSEKL